MILCHRSLSYLCYFVLLYICHWELTGQYQTVQRKLCKKTIFSVLTVAARADKASHRILQLPVTWGPLQGCWGNVDATGGGAVGGGVLRYWQFLPLRQNNNIITFSNKRRCITLQGLGDSTILKIVVWEVELLILWWPIVCYDNCLLWLWLNDRCVGIKQNFRP